MELPLRMLVVVGLGWGAAAFPNGYPACDRAGPTVPTQFAGKLDAALNVSLQCSSLSCILTANKQFKGYVISAQNPAVPCHTHSTNALKQRVNFTCGHDPVGHRRDQICQRALVQRGRTALPRRRQRLQRARRHSCGGTHGSGLNVTVSEVTLLVDVFELHMNTYYQHIKQPPQV